MVTLPTTTPLVMHARGIHKSFLRGKQRSHVLRGVDVEIRQGECVFLVGPSGSGKSTLFYILGGLTRAVEVETRSARSQHW